MVDHIFALGIYYILDRSTFAKDTLSPVEGLIFSRINFYFLLFVVFYERILFS
jgi:hypothetical protein